MNPFIFAVLSGPVQASTCGDLSEVPEMTQVAWISPIDRSVGSGAWLEVVRTQDLRRMLQEQGTEPVRMLQSLGMASQRGGRAEDERYKITLFDVRTDWLCRPIRDGVAGEVQGGVAICEEAQQHGVRGHRRGFTGCGYTMDTTDRSRGLDVYRVEWEVASTWGFCVLPLERFLDGA